MIVKTINQLSGVLPSSRHGYNGYRNRLLYLAASLHASLLPLCYETSPVKYANVTETMCSSRSNLLQKVLRNTDAQRKRESNISYPCHQASVSPTINSPLPH